MRERERERTLLHKDEDLERGDRERFDINAQLTTEVMSGRGRGREIERAPGCVPMYWFCYDWFNWANTLTEFWREENR